MKKLNNIGGYPNIQAFVNAKISRYEKQEKNFRTLFEIMFSEKENIMAEITDGYKIKKLTYGEFYTWILESAPSVKKALAGAEKDSLVGIYMNNSMEWIVAFWCILICGCRPLLINTRLDDTTIKKILTDHSVYAVISDAKEFGTKTFIAKDILVRGEAIKSFGDFGSEVIFMSSGTSDNVKLCAYTGENFFYQICCSTDIISRCPDIAEHCEGELRQLTLLPFYHVFGFIAVYLWFGFFSRTFVFLKDMNPSTILNTVRKHRVTHIFAVPMVWELIYREAMKKITARGEETLARFKKGLDICNKSGKLGDKLANKLLGEVRDGIFGSSIKFMISGGSHISADVINFFNGIGYPMVNGYGMTEAGITSVEMRKNKKLRNLGAVGQPFKYVEYKISDKGELLIRSRAMASRIITPDNIYETDFESYYNSKDLACLENGAYYISGRSDDLIICENGENINPALIEPKLLVKGCKELCLFKSEKQGPLLIACAPDCQSEKELEALHNSLKEALHQVKLLGEVKKIVITPAPLMEENEFKISRQRVAKKYENGYYPILTPDSINARKEHIATELEAKIKLCIAEILGKNAEEIGTNDDFFTDLGGNSLDYYMLRDKLNSDLNLSIPEDKKPLASVYALCTYYINQGD